MADSSISINVNVTATDEMSGSQDISVSAPLTGYTSEVNTFTFSAANISNFPWRRDTVRWDFGDGNIKTGLYNVEHSWDLPGVYDINISVLSENNRYSSGTIQAKISSWYTDQLTFVSNASVVSAGRPSERIGIQYVLPYYMCKDSLTGNTTINLYSSGSLSDPIFPDKYLASKNDHFKCIWKFIDDKSDPFPTNTFTMPRDKIYVKWDTALGKYIPGNGAVNDKVVGVSGQKLVYYIDDTNINNNVNLFASFGNSQDPTGDNIDNEGNDLGNIQTKTVMFPLSVTENEPTQLVFTSNGIPGFDIGQIKKQGTPIYYYISVADADGYILKCPYDQLTSKCLSEGSTDNDKVYHVNQSVINNTATHYYSNTAAGIITPGSFPGAVTLGQSEANVQLSASVVVPYNGAYTTITGTSNTFNVLSGSNNGYDIYKTSEDYDFYGTLMSYINQSNINNDPVLTDLVLKNIFGDETAEATSLGKTIYEKIENFVLNNSDIDTCNIDALYSVARLVGLSMDNYNLSYPGTIKRLVNLLSIKFNNLFGYNTDTIYNFYNEGHSLTEPSFDHARNLGDKINTLSYQVTAGVPIVVKELFNKSCKHIVPMILSAGDTNSLSSYPLSTYNSEWGWGLSHPPEKKFYQFYDFYEYRSNDYYNKNLLSYSSMIDWDNSQTTLDKNVSYSNWLLDDTGVIDIIYVLSLAAGFQLQSNIPGYDITSDCIPTSTTTTTTPAPVLSPSITDPELKIKRDVNNVNACD
jgi:hypothetical protein